MLPVSFWSMFEKCFLQERYMSVSRVQNGEKMKIRALIENTAISDEIESIHGLSLYIEALGHKILFDAGPNDLFLKNAKKLGVKIEDVDFMILSHGHYDHGDGIPAFLQANRKARVHVQKGAFDEYYAHDPDKIRYIGISVDEYRQELPVTDADRMALETDGVAVRGRFVIHNGDYTLDPGIQIFSGVVGRKCYSRSNDELFMVQDGKHEPDQFTHEQNLLISENGKTVMIAGCAHKGIVNIMERAEAILGQAPDIVISGFHLMNDNEEVSRAAGREVAGYLRKYPSQYYTCHCTGLPAYEELHNLMGNQIQYLSAGQEIL